MKKFRNILNWKIGTKLLVAFGFSSILPALVLQIFNVYVNQKVLDKKVNDLMVNQLVQISEKVDLKLDLYTGVIDQMDGDPNLRDNIKNFISGQNTNQTLAKHEIYRKLQSYCKAVDGIQCISVITEDGSNVIYDGGESPFEFKIWNDSMDMRKIPPFEKAQDSKEVVVSPTMSFNSNGEGERIFHLSKRLYTYEEEQANASITVVLAVDADVLEELCRQTDFWGDDENIAKYNVNFITDQNGIIISYPDPSYSGKKIDQPDKIDKFVESTGVLKDGNPSINTYVDQTYHWIIYNAYDKKYMFRDIRKYKLLSVSVSALVFLLAMFMITWTIQNIKKSSKSITNGIREVEKGNLDIQLPIYGKDEFGEIAENLNNMTEKIRNLIGQVQTMADEKRDAEITALEAQINPHFLYNTLDSINWLAISHKEYEVSQMLCDLAAILRYSVGNINHQVSIREVGEWLGHYIELQQMRYHHSFTYEGNIDPKIEGVQIHKLLIQPFMENALVHGFDGIERGGILRVDIFPSENGQLVNIIIEDNGKGMKPELVKELNREPETSSKTGGIGMFNVFSRMRMYYGEECSWKISSEENIGTVVTLVLPIREETT